MKSLCKHLISLCLSLALLLVLFPASQAEATENDPLKYLTYSIADGAVTITGCDKTFSGQMLIPDTIEGLPVTIIGDSAFSKCKKLTFVAIPDSVKTISTDAFSYCSSLKSVVFGSNVEAIGDSAFYCSALTQVTLPDSVTTLGKCAFLLCENLVQIALSNQLKTIDSGALGSLAVTELTIPASVTFIGQWALYTTSLKSVTFLGDPPKFDPQAFGTNDEILGSVSATVYYPSCNDQWTSQHLQNYGASSIRWVGNHSWDEGTSALDATCTTQGTTVYSCTGCDETKTETTPALGHRWDGGTIISSPTCTQDGLRRYCCTRCDTTKEKTIAATGHQFGAEAWVTQPTCLEDGIKSYTCSVCSFIKYEVAAAEHNAVIDPAVPATCLATGLTEGSHCGTCGEILTAQEVVPVSGHQFQKGVWIKEPTCQENGQKSYTCNTCGFIKYVTFPAEHQYENGTCIHCGELEVLASGNCGDNATWKLDAAGTLTIGGSGAMKNYRFVNNGSTSPWDSYCSQIKNVVIQEGITTISDYAFYKCTNLTDLTIPEGVTTIGSHTFFGCNSLTAIDIPESVTSIGNHAFADCTSLTNLTIPKSVTEIDMYLFSGCTSLTSITIHENVTSIDKKAFSNCSNMEEIIFLGSAPSLGEDCFNQISVTAYYPCGEDSWAPSVKQDYGGTVTWQKRHLYHSSSVQSATCTENGFTIQSCSGCGYTTVTTIPATGHNFVAGWCEYCGLNNFHGDVTGDGNINMADVARVFAHVRNKNTLTEITAILCADVTGDTKINMADVARIFAHARGKNPLF